MVFPRKNSGLRGKIFRVNYLFGGVKKRYLNAKTTTSLTRSTTPAAAMGEFEDSIARTVITAFSALPAKSKPKLRPDATEWVPLAGIALETTAGGEMICVALAWVPPLPARGEARGGGGD